MTRRRRNNGRQQGSRGGSAQPASVGPATGGRAGYVSPGGKLASFFKSRFFLTLTFLFIVLMAVGAWFRYRPLLVTVAPAVVVLTLVLGVWLVSRLRKRSDERGDAQLLNDTHDVHGTPKKLQEDFDSLITQIQPSQASASSEKAPSVEARKRERSA